MVAQFAMAVLNNGGSRGMGSLGQLPPKCLWCPLEWRPFAINAPLFGAHGSRNRDQKYLIEQFVRLVTRQDLRAGLYSTSSNSVNNAIVL